MVPIERIQTLSDHIAREFSPNRIVLFGSHARGDATSDSDVDLLVVMSYEGSGIRKAADIARSTLPEFPVDFVVRSPEELTERLAQGDFFLRDAMAEGKVLYEAAD